MANIETKALFELLFKVCVSAADPAVNLKAYLPTKPLGRVIVIGAGKSTGRMAEALEEIWDGPLEGAIVLPHGHVANVRQLKVLYASHPVPDASGIEASKELLSLVNGLTADDLVIALISGGGSALLPSPAAGMTLEDEIAVNQALLASGAPTSAMNVVRKHLSLIKGGQLALAAYPAKVHTLIVSDIPGDNPAMVASGPTVPDESTRMQALQIVDDYNITLPVSARNRLLSSKADLMPMDDIRFKNNKVQIIASAARSLEAVSAKANELGIPSTILSDAIEGEAKDIGLMHAAIAKEVITKSRPFQAPILLISGGETTVSLGKSTGKGGRNSEFLLSLAISIEGAEGIYAFAGDTDGRDGSESNAGAFADYTSTMRMRQCRIDPKTYLNTHDSWTAFNAIGDLFNSGSTGTNVNDLRLVLVTYP